MGLLTRRPIALWLGLPAILAVGIAGGFLAANLATGGSPPPAATAAHHQEGGHLMPDGTQMGGHAHSGHQEAGHQGGGTHSSWSRPAVLGTFGVVNAGIVITAFLLRPGRRSSHPRTEQAGAAAG